MNLIKIPTVSIKNKNMFKYYLQLLLIVKYIVLLIKLHSRKFVDNFVAGCFHVSFS